jgi:hypothetical protein
MLSDNEVYNTILNWNLDHPSDKYSGDAEKWNF